jgi:hypothetical protein
MSSMTQAPEDPVALYVPDGDRFVPTVATIGPWDRKAQHGGAAAALLARAVEVVDAPIPVQVTRLTYDLWRPVPLAPLTIRTTVVRPGKRVSVVEAALVADDVEVMRVSAQGDALGDHELPDGVVPGDVAPGPVGEGELAIALGDGPAYNDTGVEIRFVTGGFQKLGPGAAWVRLRVPVVAGEEPTPLQRIAATGDLGNGVSSVLKMRDWLYLNPDLTIHVARPPVGEWLCIDAVTYPSGTGAGLAESALYDATGRVGRSVQSLLIAPQR